MVKDVDVWVISIFLTATMVSVVTVIVIVLWERHRRIEHKKRKEMEVKNIIKLQQLADEPKVEILRKWQ